MTVPPDDWPRLKDTFSSARALTAEQRPAYLAAACGNNDALREELESLLAWDGRAKSFLETPAVVPDAGAGVTPSREGQRIAQYELASRIGAGGMGEVYEARDTTLNRQVAIKVLLPAVAGDPDRLARFRREAQVLASLNHPHIGAIYGVEESAGVPALVLELVAGPTLAERLAAGPIPVTESLGIARQIAEALEAAHARGIVHRDLTPANIKITPGGTVKVLDFGLAKAAASDGAAGDLSSAPAAITTGTRDSALMGTPSYMSPEQARGLPVDTRTDIWAFGCVAYEMLTGHTVFAGETMAEHIAAILDRDPDWTALPERLPPDFRRILRRCLAKDPARRLQAIGDARVVIEDLLSGVAGRSAGAMPALSWRRARRALPWAVAGGLAVFLVLGSRRRGEEDRCGHRPVAGPRVG